MNLLLLIALLLYLVGAVYSLITFTRQERGRSLTLLTLLALGFAAHSSWLTMRWVELEHFPIVSLKEVSAFIAWAMLAYYLLIGLRYQTRALPAFILPFVCLLSLAGLLLPESDQAMSVALSNAVTASHLTQIIFPVHVTLVVFAYAAFVVTFISSAMYLVQERELKAKNFGVTFQRLPALNTCDEIGYRSLTIGFALLTLGMLTGMIWNQQRDGRYWHNDPKEVMALVTWLIYLTMIHYRVTAGWRGRRVAWLAIAGFVVVLFTWVGARFMGGYHVFG
jgi:cytochrome c-type biogenesis protein CcsB